MDDKYIEKLLETKFQGMEKYLKISFKNIDGKFTDMSDSVKNVHAEQKKTNGNVLDLQKYKWKITGAMIIISTILIPIAFIVIGSFLK